MSKLNPFEVIFTPVAIEEESPSTVGEIHDRAILPIQNSPDVNLEDAYAKHYDDVFNANKELRTEVITSLRRRVSKPIVPGSEHN